MAEEVKSGDSTGHISVFSKKCTSLLRAPDVSSSNDSHAGDTEVAVSSGQVHCDSQVVNPSRRKRRRKQDRTVLQKDRNYDPSGCSSDRSSVPQDSLQDVKVSLLISDNSFSGFLCLLTYKAYAYSLFVQLKLQGRLLHCLSWHEVRRWCVYEWFYSAIDYPWFAKREFVEYLDHVGLGHIPRLTRFELGVIRKYKAFFILIVIFFLIFFGCKV